MTNFEESTVRTRQGTNLTTTDWSETSTLLQQVVDLAQNLYLLTIVVGAMSIILLFLSRHNRLVFGFLSVLVVLLVIELVEALTIMAHTTSYFNRLLFYPAHGGLFYFYLVALVIQLALVCYFVANPAVFQLPMRKANGSEHQDDCVIDHKIKQFVDPLTEAMNEDKLYLNAGLNLGALAEHIEASSSDVSRVLKLEFETNFYDFVNHYRVEEAKRLLRQSQHKVLAVAFDSGFNSKSNFNKLFKQHTGLTPSDYRKQANQQVLSGSYSLAK